MFEQQPPIRVDYQPSLGADLAFMANQPEAKMPVARPVLTPETLFLVTGRLDILIAEVNGLREDLARRSAWGRTTRCWRWLCVRWDLFMSLWERP